MSAASARLARLKPALDQLYAGFNRQDSAADPVHLVRPFERPDDREVVAFIAAALAFGRVASIQASIGAVLAVMGDRPAAFVRAFDPSARREAMTRLGHRWIRGHDLMALLWVLRQMLERSGSIEQCFVDGHEPGAVDVGPALDRFSARACDLDLDAVYPRAATRRVGYFFPRPGAGSACKRLNLFLRWMVRRDEVDLGVWTRVSPSQLVVPLDTHVIRVGRCLRLTAYRSPGWRMAADITASLRAIDPHDPVRYDFSLCHLGMMNACGFGTSRGSRECPLRGVCHPGRRAAW
jgi:uncharacterized protein (TIGR02757 family)